MTDDLKIIKQLPETILELGLDIDVDSDSHDVIKSNKNAIFLEGNPLEKPPIEIIRQGNEAIRAYFKSLEGKKVKLLPVYDGDAGKTSMVKRLLNDSKEKEHTASDQKLKEIKRLSKKIEQLKIDLQKEKKLKELCDGEAEKKARRFSWRFALLNIFILIAWAVLIFRFGWDVIEKWTFLAGLFALVIHTVIFAYRGKAYNSREAKAQRLEIEKKRQYTLHRFSMEEYTRLNRDMENAQRLHQQLLE